MPLNLTPLKCGTIKLDSSIITGTDYGEPFDAPSIVYLIEGEETVLIDTTFGDPERCSELHYPSTRSPDETLEAVLDGEGYAPTDIDIVVLTHLHWDHCYNLDLFEHADIYVQRNELEYAIAPYGLDAISYEAKSAGLRPPWLDATLIPVEGETEIVPDVTVFPTPGHTVGMQSVEVKIDGKTVVAASDAIPTYDNIKSTETSEMRPGAAMNTHVWWRSAQEIVDRADEILPGHEQSLFDD